MSISKDSYSLATNSTKISTRVKVSEHTVLYNSALKTAEYPIASTCIHYRENLDVPAKLDFSAAVPRVACGVALTQLRRISAQVI